MVIGDEEDEADRRNDETPRDQPTVVAPSPVADRVSPDRQASDVPTRDAPEDAVATEGGRQTPVIPPLLPWYPTYDAPPSVVSSVDPAQEDIASPSPSDASADLPEEDGPMANIPGDSPDETLATDVGFPAWGDTDFIAVQPGASACASDPCAAGKACVAFDDNVYDCVQQTQRGEAAPLEVKADRNYGIILRDNREKMLRRCDGLAAAWDKLGADCEETFSFPYVRMVPRAVQGGLDGWIRWVGSILGGRR